MTAIATYLLTRELWNSRAGLFAACFIAIGKTVDISTILVIVELACMTNVLFEFYS